MSPISETEKSIGTIIDNERTIAAILEDPARMFQPAPVFYCTEGFTIGINLGNSLFSCYRDEIMRKARIEGALRHWFPSAGRFHLGFVLIDEEDTTFDFTFSTRDQQPLRVTTERADGLRHIYITSQAFDIAYAQKFDMEFSGDGTRQAVEGIVFLPEPLEQTLSIYPGPLSISTTRKPAAESAVPTSLELHNLGGLRGIGEVLRFPLPPEMDGLRSVRMGARDLPFHLRKIGSEKGVRPNLQLEVLLPYLPARKARVELIRDSSSQEQSLPLLTSESEAERVLIHDGDNKRRWVVQLEAGTIQLEGPGTGRIELEPVLEDAFEVRGMEMRVEYASPLVVDVACRTFFRKPADPAIEVLHGTRLRFIAGRDRVDIEQLLENHSPHPFLFLTRYGLNVRTKNAAVAALDAEGRSHPVNSFTTMRHTDRMADATLEGLSEGVEYLPHSLLLGKCQITIGEWDLSAPLRLAAVPGAAEIDFLPEASTVKKDSDPEYQFRNQFFLEDGQYKLRQGMARRHLCSLSWTGAKHRPAEAMRLDAPAFLHTPAAYDGIELLFAPAFTRSKHFRETTHSWIALWDRHEEATRPWNFFSAGDWFGERINNWGNNEYDTPFAHLQLFLNTGDPAWLHRGIASARHQIDVDTLHGNHPLAGWQIPHSLAHGGHYFPDEYRVGAKNTKPSICHLWVEGMLLYHWITGDARAKSVAMRLLDDLAGPQLKNWKLGYERQPGWHLVHLCAGAAVLGEDRYLAAAGLLVKRILERQRPDGSLRRVLASDHCGCYPRHTGGVSFMLGILLKGLRRFHQLTGDEATKDAIVRMGRFVERDMWVESEQLFRYTSCPNSTLRPMVTSRLVEGLLYSAYLAGDEKAFKRWKRLAQSLLDQDFPEEVILHQRNLGESVFGHSMSGTARMIGPAFTTPSPS